MKLSLIFLLFFSITLHAQTISWRQADTMPNNHAPGSYGFPIGFNVRDNGNLLFYWSQAVKQTLLGTGDKGFA